MKFLRQVIFPTGHKLDTWNAGIGYGSNSHKTRIGYMLYKDIDNPIFNGTDFFLSPLHADDSDECLRELMGFLTLRPGDTDREFFDDYTDEQLLFCSEYAEQLSLWAQDDGPPFMCEGDLLAGDR